MQLLDPGCATSKSGKDIACDEDFINPFPDDHFIGNMRLREYLIDCDLGWVIRLRELIEESDLSEFKTRYRSTGRKAIHPAVMLGLIVYGIIECKSSLRELELLASKDVGAWWVCGGLRPDHSTIGKFIVRFDEILSEKYFVDLTRMLLKKLRIKSGDVAGDGTVIEAAANRYKTIKAEAVREAAAIVENRAEANPGDEGLKREAAEARDFAELADDREAAIIKHGRRDPKKLKLSETDSDAVFQKMKNTTIRPSYKPSILANTQQIIVGNHVDPSDETASVLPMLDQHRSIFGGLPDRAMFDANYHNMTVLSMSVELDMDVLCPSSKADQGQWERKFRAGKFDKSNFIYDHDRDVYVCPSGAELRPGRSREKDGMQVVTYRAGAHCDGCELRSKCTGNIQGRAIDRYEVDELKEAMAQVFENERARKSYCRRKA
ncbi:MAG: hypothetical protein GY841_02020, partial [FCB group bacterium]|nr:hypothetical protein [FCB group bacterium]